MSLHHTLTEKNALLHVAVAGAGIELIRQIWETPGSSQYLAGASLLQARREMDNFIGFRPEEGYCHETTAIDMAFTAYLRAVKCGADEEGPHQPVGLALTASVASSRIPRGDQRAHIAILTPRGLFTHVMLFPKEKGQAARQQQDLTIANTVTGLLIDALEQSEAYPPNPSGFEQLRKHPLFLPDGRRRKGLPRKGAYFPANFDPIHDGHRLACKEAEKRIGTKVHFMIEAIPPHKPAIPLPELLRRVAMLQLEQVDAPERGRAVVITMGEVNYLDKARARPGSRFIAGADAVQRFLQPGWGYDVDYMLEEMENLNTKFYVLGRRIGERFVTLDDIDIPPAFRHLFEHLDGACDISSSQIRAEQAKDQESAK